VLSRADALPRFLVARGARRREPPRERERARGRGRGKEEDRERRCETAEGWEEGEQGSGERGRKSDADDEYARDGDARERRRGVAIDFRESVRSRRLAFRRVSMPARCTAPYSRWRRRRRRRWWRRTCRARRHARGVTAGGARGSGGILPELAKGCSPREMRESSASGMRTPHVSSLKRRTICIPQAASRDWILARNQTSSWRLNTRLVYCLCPRSAGGLRVAIKTRRSRAREQLRGGCICDFVTSVVPGFQQTLIARVPRAIYLDEILIDRSARLSAIIACV